MTVVWERRAAHVVHDCVHVQPTPHARKLPCCAVAQLTATSSLPSYEYTEGRRKARRRVSSLLALDFHHVALLVRKL